MILIGFPTLEKSFFINVESNSLSEFYYIKIMDRFKETLLQHDPLNNSKINENYDDLAYLNVNSLDFFLKFWSLNDRGYLKKPFDELKIEYVRRIMHQIYVISSKFSFLFFF